MKKFFALLTLLSVLTLTVGCGGGEAPTTPPTVDADGEHADGHEEDGHTHADGEEDGDADATPPAADEAPAPADDEAPAPADGE